MYFCSHFSFVCAQCHAFTVLGSLDTPFPGPWEHQTLFDGLFTKITTPVYYGKIHHFEWVNSAIND